MAEETDIGGITAADLDTPEPVVEKAPPVEKSVEKEPELDASLFEDFDIAEEVAEEKKPAVDTNVSDELDPDAPSIARQLKEKYPNIFKEVPALRKALFAGPQVLEIFNTPEEARTAYKRIEAMDHVIDRTLQGDVGVLLDNLYEVDPGSIKGIVENFLPTIHQKAPELWKAAIAPVFAAAVRDMIKTAEANQNKNLFITAKNFSQHIFGSPDPPEFGNHRPANNGPDPEKQKLEEHNKQLNKVLSGNFSAAVGSTTVSTMEKEISDRLDPKNVIPQAIKQLVVERAVKEVRGKLAADQSHISRMNLLHARAAKDNFDDKHKKTLIDAYLSSARLVIPGVVQKVRSELLAKNTAGNVQKTKAPDTRPRNEAGQYVEKTIDPKKVAWDKYNSDADFLFSDKVATR